MANFKVAVGIDFDASTFDPTTYQTCYYETGEYHC